MEHLCLDSATHCTSQRETVLDISKRFYIMIFNKKCFNVLLIIKIEA